MSPLRLHPVRIPVSSTGLVCQLALAATMVVTCPFLEDMGLTSPVGYTIGMALILLLTVAVIGAFVAERADRWFPAWGPGLLIAIPIVDFLVLGVVRWATQGGVGFHGFLMVLPAVWLAGRVGLRGATWATLLTWGVSAAGVPVVAEAALVPYLVRSVVLVIVVPSIAFVFAMMVAEIKDRTDRLDLVTSSLGVVHAVMGPDGVLGDARGRLRGAAHDVPIQTLLRGRLFAENGRDELPAERHPLVRIRARGCDTSDVVWAQDPQGRRVALSISSRRDGAGAVLVVVHDVTATLMAVLQEEQFLANVSHELKTPLTSISGYLELLEDEALGSRDEGDGRVDAEVLTGHVGVIRRNVRRLESLIMDLLETARTTGAVSGRHDEGLERRATDLSMLLRRQVESIRPAARLRDVSVDVSVPREGVEIINADPERLAQALDNVLSNAVKYSRVGGAVHVDLDVHAGHARVMVRDEGIGIATEDLERLFTPYFRARTAVRSGVEGTGIGLMILRRIIRAHGGDVTIDSREGEGTTITLTVPLVRT